MFMFQQDNDQTEVPEAPFFDAPDAPPLDLSPPPPLLFDQPRENNDPKVREILQSGDPLEIQQGFETYEKLLRSQLTTLNSQIRAQESLNNADIAKCNDIDSAITKKEALRKLFEKKIELLPEVLNITSEERNNASARFTAKRVELSEENAAHLADKTLLMLEIDKRTQEIAKLERERTSIKSKQKALTTSKNRAVEDGVIAASRQVRIVVPAIASGRSLDEDKLCQMSQLFVNIRPKTGCVIFYKQQEILALQLKTFDEQDWGNDDEATLESKLRNALVLCRNDIKGLGPTPRESMRAILGYDIVDAYEQREREKQAEAERRRQALRAQRLETKEREEAENLAPTTINDNLENSRILQQRGNMVQSSTPNEIMRTPERTVLLRRLEEAQQSFRIEMDVRLAEQTAQLKAEEEARLIAEAARLKAEEEARLAVEEAQRLREEAQKREREQRNSEAAAASEQLAPRLTLEQKSNKAFANMKRKR
jgi:hypothetical protein